MLALWIGVFVLALFLAGWVYFDAIDNAQYPCLWVIMIMMFPPLIIVYALLRLYTMRKASRRTVEQFERERIGAMDYRFGSEIERSRFIEASQKGHGTLFEPDNVITRSAAGFQHFTVERAEKLFQERRLDEAWDFLTEMYAVAEREQDVRAMDTYRHYISRLPNGSTRLHAWLDRQGAVQDKPEPKPKRDVPF